MSARLDRTQLRVLGVLLEKELAVPASYPMTEAALVSGCNQKSNREPEMSLEPFEVTGALTALQLDSWVTRIDGGRTPHFRHRIDDRLGLQTEGKAVLAELLLRGPQAPGALRGRVSRMGFADASADDVRRVLEQLAAGVDPLVHELPQAPRERDRRWAHRLGGGDSGESAGESAGEEPPRTAPVDAPERVRDEAQADSLEARVARLERDVAELRALLDGGAGPS